MAVHACLGVLAPAGRLIVYGGNDEGVRSASAVIGKCCGPVATLAARGHGRVLAARAPEDRSGVRAALADWRRTTRLVIGGQERSWVSYPGMFAAGRIDAATSLLVAHLPRLAPGARLLDFGCGSGVIGASALSAPAGPLPGAALIDVPSAARTCGGPVEKVAPGRLALDMLDNDTLALAAAAENIPEGRPLLAAALADAPRGYAAILSNPPLHRGIARDLGRIEELIAEAPQHLLPGGVLVIVVQRAVDAERLLRARFADVAMLAQSDAFRVWRARDAQLATGRGGTARRGGAR
jgi:16S rRNA (guanine1207-N2)-methyltransferase